LPLYTIHQFANDVLVAKNKDSDLTMPPATGIARLSAKVTHRADNLWIFKPSPRTQSPARRAIVNLSSRSKIQFSKIERLVLLDLVLSTHQLEAAMPNVAEQGGHQGRTSEPAHAHFIVRAKTRRAVRSD
jgi:hypothetical protein